MAYGIGNIAINLIAMALKSADKLAITCLLIVCFSVIPSFFFYTETPKFQYKAGKLSGMINSLLCMAKSNGKELTELDLLQDLTGGDADTAQALSGKQIRVAIKPSNHSS